MVARYDTGFEAPAPVGIDGPIRQARAAVETAGNKIGGAIGRTLDGAGAAVDSAAKRISGAIESGLVAGQSVLAGAGQAVESAVASRLAAAEELTGPISLRLPPALKCPPGTVWNPQTQTCLPCPPVAPGVCVLPGQPNICDYPVCPPDHKPPPPPPPHGPPDHCPPPPPPPICKPCEPPPYCPPPIVCDPCLPCPPCPPPPCPALPECDPCQRTFPQLYIAVPDKSDCGWHLECAPPQCAAPWPDLGPMGNLVINRQPYGEPEERERVIQYYGEWTRPIMEADDVTALVDMKLTAFEGLDSGDPTGFIDDTEGL